jgi:hypothetical protein
MAGSISRTLPMAGSTECTFSRTLSALPDGEVSWVHKARARVRARVSARVSGRARVRARARVSARVRVRVRARVKKSAIARRYVAGYSPECCYAVMQNTCLAAQWSAVISSAVARWMLSSSGVQLILSGLQLSQVCCDSAVPQVCSWRHRQRTAAVSAVAQLIQVCRWTAVPCSCLRYAGTIRAACIG